MRDFTQLVKRVETRWLEVLYDFCKAQFQHVKLPSHDHSHHARVWLIAKALFWELDQCQLPIMERDLEKTIIAAFFHDIGMTVTRAPQHGRIGREICAAFFADQPLPPIVGFEEVLDAIERHDDKEYRDMVSDRESVHTSVLSVLSVSDDLDAFGAIGVFRYAEIYLLRAIPMAALAEPVLENLSRRYANFQRLYGQYTAFFHHHTRRYDLTRRFYQECARQWQHNAYSEESWAGPAGVLNYFRKHVIEGDATVEEVVKLALAQARAQYVLDFFYQFQKELRELKIED